MIQNQFRSMMLTLKGRKSHNMVTNTIYTGLSKVQMSCSTYLRVWIDILYIVESQAETFIYLFIYIYFTMIIKLQYKYLDTWALMLRIWT